MTSRHKLIITENFDVLAEDLSSHKVLNKFVAKQIIDSTELESFLEMSPGKRATQLLMLLLKREDRAFYVLIEACKKYNMSHLAKLLEDAGGNYNCRWGGLFCIRIVSDKTANNI